MELNDKLIDLQLPSGVVLSILRQELVNKTFQLALKEELKHCLHDFLHCRWNNFLKQKDIIHNYKSSRREQAALQEKQYEEKVCQLRQEIDEKNKEDADLTKQINQAQTAASQSLVQTQHLQGQLEQIKGAIKEKEASLQKTVRSLKIAIGWYMRYMGIQILLERGGSVCYVNFWSFDGSFRRGQHMVTFYKHGDGYSLSKDGEPLSNAEILRTLSRERKIWRASLRQSDEMDQI